MNATANTTNLTDGMRLTVEALKKNGIDTIFGVVGIPVTDLARYAQKEGIRYIGFRHEQSAGNAAAASGFITGRPGILLTVSAPGFLNGLGALANATVNGFPMIQISGSSDRAIIDLEQGDYEGLDQLNIARPFAKAAYRVNRPEDICTGLVRAVRAAVSGRPGGVYLDLTTAMLAAELDRDTAAASLFSPVDPAPAVIPRPKNRWSSSAKVPPMRRQTGKSGNLSKQPAFPTCRCQWPRDCCPTTTRKARPRHVLSYWKTPTWSCWSVPASTGCSLTAGAGTGIRTTNSSNSTLIPSKLTATVRSPHRWSATLPLPCACF